MSILETVVLVPLAGLLAAVLHELTHWTVARLGGRQAWISWRELNCYHVLPISGPVALDYLVGVAPFMVGSVVGVGYVAAVNPPATVTVLPELVAWGVYTLNGIPNDFRIQPGESPEL